MAVACVVFSHAFCASAATLEALRKEGFNVNVRVQDTLNPLRLGPTADSDVIDATGRVRFSLKKGEFARVEVERVKQPENPYTVSLKSFDQYDKSSARRTGSEARSLLGMEVRVARLRPGANPRLQDTPCGALAVCAGAYETLSDATKDLPAVRKYYPSAEIVRPQSKSLPRSRLRFKSYERGDVGVLAGPVTIRPSDPLDMLRAISVGEITGTASDWRRGYANDYYCQGAIILDSNFQYRLIAVDRTDVETYLRGVVPAEIGNAPFEALKAQAIASRSEALARVDSGHYPDPLYDLCTTVRTQVSHGIKAATALSDHAILETAGEVMLYDGAIIDAVFSANCGGVTASSEEVWDGARIPYLRGKTDEASPRNPNLNDRESVFKWLFSSPNVYSNPNGSTVIPEAERGYFRWRERLSVADLTREINKRYPVGLVKDVRVLDRTASGRAKSVEIAGDRKTVRVSGQDEVRKALGGVYSAFFVITPERDDRGRLTAITLYGAGYGHGVGMCQTGARRMAAEGHTSTEILKHYYSGVVVNGL